MGLVLAADGQQVATVPSPVVRLRETVSLVSRQIEDLAWDNLSRDDVTRSLDDDTKDRQDLIRRARLTAKRNPMARQAIDLLQHYVLGQGLTIKAANKSLVARLIDEFLEHSENEATLTSHDAQKEFLERLYVDGDVYYVLFADRENGLLRVGWLDALLVDDIIPDPENRKIPKWYKVKAPGKIYNFTTGAWETRDTGKFVYYRHWRNDDPKPAGMSDVQEGVVYQVSIDKSGLFGRSKLATAIDWLRAHRDFMQDRATLNRAAASVAWKKKRTGAGSDIAREVERIQSSIVGNPTRYETNPTPSSGSTVVENTGSTLEWVKTDTGGGAADYDERKLRMMAGSGMGGIPNHYFGDEAQSNLATATAMELPLLKAYEDWQQTLRQVLLDIFTFYLTACNEAGRLGPDDDSARYAEHVTTPQAVMDLPDQDSNLPAAPTQLVEALTLPFQQPPQPGLRLMPRPADAPTLPTEPPDPTKPVSWYIDIDFPPIVQKDLDKFMNALKVLADLLPTEVLEAKKLVVELALGVFGVNDIDHEIERIFPADMVGVLVPRQPPQVPPQLAAGPNGQQPGQPGAPAAVGGQGAPGPGPQPAPMQESIADIRRRRLLAVVREAGATYAGAVVGG